MAKDLKYWAKILKALPSDVQRQIGSAIEKDASSKYKKHTDAISKKEKEAEKKHHRVIKEGNDYFAKLVKKVGLEKAKKQAKDNYEKKILASSGAIYKIRRSKKDYNDFFFDSFKRMKLGLVKKTFNGFSKKKQEEIEAKAKKIK